MDGAAMSLELHGCGMGVALTKRILLSRSAAADLRGDVLDWARDGWWFRAWPGRCGTGG
jgi:hypothetical protein